MSMWVRHNQTPADRRHVKGLVLLRDQRRLCQGRDSVPPLGNVGTKLERVRKGLLTEQQTFWWDSTALEECRGQLMMSATNAKEKWQVWLGVHTGVTA